MTSLKINLPSDSIPLNILSLLSPYLIGLITEIIHRYLRSSTVPHYETFINCANLKIMIKPMRSQNYVKYNSHTNNGQNNGCKQCPNSTN